MLELDILNPRGWNVFLSKYYAYYHLFKGQTHLLAKKKQTPKTRPEVFSGF
jgi:hypothetical protein